VAALAYWGKDLPAEAKQVTIIKVVAVEQHKLAPTVLPRGHMEKVVTDMPVLSAVLPHIMVVVVVAV
jgi:hypothetical protein